MHHIARDLRIDNWRVASLLESLGLKDRTEARGGTKRPEETRERALALYQETNPDGNARYGVEWIAREVGLRSATTVTLWADQAGISRPAKVPQGAKPREIRLAALARYAATGRDAIATARELGIGQTTMRRWIEHDLHETPVREQVLGMWQDNQPAEQIAAELNTTPRIVERMARDAGLPARGRGWKSWPPSTTGDRRAPPAAAAAPRVVSGKL